MTTGRAPTLHLRNALVLWPARPLRPAKPAPILHSHDDARRVHRRVWLSQCCNHALTATFGRTQIHEQHLIYFVIDNRRQVRAAPRQVAPRQLAFEDRVLQMVTIPAHNLKHLAPALVVADVVADQIGGAHAIPPPPRVRLHGNWTDTCSVYTSGFDRSRLCPAPSSHPMVDQCAPALPRRAVCVD